MTSQPGWQTIEIHIFTNISRIKGNQTMKLGEYFFKNYAENGAGILVPDLFLSFKKVSYSLVSIYFDSPQPEIQQKQTV